MLRRLFMALLILCLATPAVALPAHCAPAAQDHAMAMAHHGGHGDHHRKAPEVQIPAHDCIGCIAPYAGDPPQPSAPLHGRPPLGQFRPDFRALASPAPDTPPPRP